MTQADIRSEISQLLDRAEAVLQSRLASLKSIATIVYEYRGELQQEVDRAFLGKLTPRALQTEINNSIERFAARAFLEGMSEGGVDTTFGDLEDDERTAIDDWANTQLDHVADFAAAVDAAGSDVTAREAILSRLDMWVGSLRNLADLGKGFAQQNRKGEWQFGDTVHCDTCAWLNGQQHRVKWFIGKGYLPRQNGSETLDCGGWNCQCKVVDAKTGEQLL